MNRFGFSLFIFAVFAFLSLTRSVALADIVLVNVNQGTQEIKLLQAMVQTTRERLIILPSENVKGYDTEKLAQDMVRLAEQGVRPRAFIVSGHHFENQYLYGENGGIYFHQLKKYLPSSPSPALRDFLASVRSLYLWGCYTGTLSNTAAIIDRHNNPFSNVQFVVGFLKKGPLGTSPESGTILRNAILNEKDFRAASGEQKSRIIKMILSGSHYDMISHEGQNFYTKDSASRRDLFIKNCQTPETFAKINEHVSVIRKYFENKITPIPADTRKGPLRQAYEKVQEFRYCIEMNMVKPSAENPYLPFEIALRLIYYKNVITNFSRIYAAHLRYAHQIFVQKGIPNSEFIMRLDQMDRSDVIENLAHLNEAIWDKYCDLEDLNKRAQYIFLRRLVTDIMFIVYPSEEHIDPTWIDPDAISGADDLQALGFPLAFAKVAASRASKPIASCSAETPTNEAPSSKTEKAPSSNEVDASAYPDMATNPELSRFFQPESPQQNN